MVSVMIQYAQGNLLDAQVESVVNTVNEVGVMGKGIALMFREAFPENYRVYAAACERHEVKVGHMLVTRNNDLTGPRFIINFPTKKHWRHPSKMEWIRAGLSDLARVLRREKIRSVALPPLGCGNGGLDWNHVRREIEAALSDLKEINIIVYAPINAYQNAPKRSGVEQLTPARALLAELIRRYWILGIECTNLEVQKLAWFLHRVIAGMGLDDPLRVKFSANRYGPYADQLRHLMDSLDGSYLHCDKRLADAAPWDIIWFDDSRRKDVSNYLAGELQYASALEKTAQIIDGFESPFGMELLSTVDWLLQKEHCPPSVEGIRKGLAVWPGGTAAAKRKKELFSEEYVALALDRLAQFSSVLAPSLSPRSSN